MIDPTKEDLITLSDAARKVPRRRQGRPVNTSTIFRWAQHGCRGINLETIQTPGGKCTSLEALARFFAALSGVSQVPAAGENVTDADVEAELGRRGYTPRRGGRETT